MVPILEHLLQHTVVSKSSVDVAYRATLRPVKARRSGVGAAPPHEPPLRCSPLCRAWSVPVCGGLNPPVSRRVMRRVRYYSVRVWHVAVGPG